MEIKFVDRLKELMKEAKLNQVQLASKTGLRQNTISHWLSNTNTPSIENLWTLADFFDVDIDYLVGRKEY